MILCFIFISTGLLILEEPLADPHSPKKHVLDTLDKVMTGVFILEALVKSTVYGFACNGQRSYLRDAWNIMDFLIVCASIAGLPFD